ARLRVFVQVLSRDDFDTFVDGLVAEVNAKLFCSVSLIRWLQAPLATTHRSAATMACGRLSDTGRRRAICGRTTSTTSRGNTDSGGGALANFAARGCRRRLRDVRALMRRLLRPLQHPTSVADDWKRWPNGTTKCPPYAHWVFGRQQ